MKTSYRDSVDWDLVRTTDSPYDLVRAMLQMWDPRDEERLAGWGTGEIDWIISARRLMKIHEADPVVILVEELRSCGAYLHHKRADKLMLSAAAEIERLRSLVHLYDHMRAVTQAAGFESITAAITAVRKGVSSSLNP